MFEYTNTEVHQGQLAKEGAVEERLEEVVSLPNWSTIERCINARRIRSKAGIAMPALTSTHSDSALIFVYREETREAWVLLDEEKAGDKFHDLDLIVEFLTGDWKFFELPSKNSHRVFRRKIARESSLQVVAARILSYSATEE